MEELDVRWYALYTRSRHEKVVVGQLGEKNIECFLPLRETISYWKDRRKKVQHPLFPGYVFVHASIRERRLDILKVPAAVGLIESNGGPISIPEEQIQSVRRLLSSTLLYDPYPEVVQGDRVEVIRGPLRGVYGILVRKKTGDRFVLAVDLIQQAVACEIDACNLKKINGKQRPN
ncbi:MAG TPA: UpxY family transcription antiterminator [Terriglobia bacterium]|nr:UpxY family transcription antiterminator [Terriglobia bacterium]